MATRKTALITGGTSGIGKAYAERFAQMGYDLILTGRRKKVIESVALGLSKKYGVRARVVIAELADERGVQKILKVIKEAKSIEVLVNNAGYGLERLFMRERVENHLDMIRVHVLVPVRFVHAVLPGMAKSGRGIIINVSSLGAYTPSPINSIYGGTKAFLNVFTESLHMELRHKGIRVQSVCPGFTISDFHGRMGIKDPKKNMRVHWMEPEKVVECSMKYLEKGRVICIPGLRNRALYLLIHLVPRRLYYRAVSRMFGRYLREK